MFKVGDYAVYKKDVCYIEEKKEKHFPGMMYYILKPMDDQSLTIDVPVENSKKLLKEIMSSDEAKELINNILDIDPIESNDKFLENQYKSLLRSGEKEDLIKIIKTTYIRNEQRLQEGKKIGEKDNEYFNKAERLLYNELSLALDIDYKKTKKYVTNKLEKSSNE